MSARKTTESAKLILKAFVTDLEEVAEDSVDVRQRARGHIIELGTAPPIALYVLVRSEGRGFWGLNRNRIHELCRSGHPWYAVLVGGELGYGYHISSTDVLQCIDSGAWTRVDDAYKINEPSDVKPEWRLDSSEDEFEWLSRLVTTRG